MNVIGIDPGLGGGVTCFRPGFLRSSPIEIGPMPRDLMELNAYFKEKMGQGLYVFIEKVQPWVSDNEAPGKNIQIAKLFSQYSKIIMMLDVQEIPYLEVPPQTWQRYIAEIYQVKPKKFKNKKNAWKSIAIQLFPQKLKQINLKTSDSVCIAWYGYHQLSKNPTEVREKMKHTTP